MTEEKRIGRRLAAFAATILLVLVAMSTGVRLSSQPAADGPLAYPWRCLTTGAARAVFPAVHTGECLPTGALASWSLKPRIRALVLPQAPGTLSGAISGTTVTLNWSAPASGDSPTSYFIEAGSSAGATDVVQVDLGSTSTSLIATSVAPGTYYVRVRAVNASGRGAVSNEIVVTIGVPCAQTPGSPAGLTASVVENEVTLTWQAPEGDCAPTAYVIEAGSSTGWSNVTVFSTGSPATSFAASGVASGTYFVRVRSTNARGSSGPSNEVSITISAPTPNPTPIDHAFDLLESFIGMDFTLGSMSPDVSLAVGRGHFLLVRNSAIALWRKSTSVDGARTVAATTLSTFFAPVVKAGDKLTDPYTLFDDDAGRFFIVNAAFNTCPECGFHLLAVSKSSSPETLTDRDWYFYRLDRGLERTSTGVAKTEFDGDYDNLAALKSSLLIGWQATRHTTNPDGSRSVAGIGGRVRALDKQALMAGQAPTDWADLLPSAPFNARARLAIIPDLADRVMEPGRAFVDLYSEPPCGRSNTWIIGAVTWTGGIPAMTTRSVASPSFVCSNEAVAPQPDGARSINVRHLGVQPVYRNGKLWLFEVRGASTQDSRAAILWMELDVKGWPAEARVLQYGSFSEAGVAVFAPAATVDPAGNLVMVYTRSGVSEYPSIYYTGRLASDPPNTLRLGQRLKSGSRSFDWRSPGGTEQSNQFIDYGTATVDPVDGSMWMTALVPSPGGLSATGFERSDAWIGRVRPLNATR